MRLIVFIAALVCLAAPASAQTNFMGERDDNNTSGKIYSTTHFASLADQAIAGARDKFSFRHLRMFYVGSRQYQATSEDLIRQMVTHAYTVQTTEDWIERDKALGTFQNLVRDHLANIGAVEQALSLSRQDARFGEPLFYEWVIDGLVSELLDSGNGTSPRKAYDIVTIEEENYLLRELGLHLVSREASHRGVKYYSMLTVENPETADEPYLLFIDATRPLTKIQEDLDKPSFSVDLGGIQDFGME